MSRVAPCVTLGHHLVWCIVLHLTQRGFQLKRTALIIVRRPFHLLDFNTTVGQTQVMVLFELEIMHFIYNLL